MANLKVTYDKAAGAAYIYLTDPTSPAAAKSSFMYACDPLKVNGMINLDFDAEGRLIGVEVLDARAKLPPHLLDQAERLDAADR